MSIRLTSTLFSGVVFALAACNVTQPGATDAGLAKARDQASQGASSYATRCAHCHGERGEGKAYTPAIIGAGALPVYPRDASTSPTTTDPVQLQMQSQTRPPGAPSRSALHNAQDLFDYLSRHTPEQNLRSLTPPELWTIVTFMLIAHGSQVPPGGVTPENASRISI
jgi:hypothetical protein